MWFCFICPSNREIDVQKLLNVESLIQSRTCAKFIFLNVHCGLFFLYFIPPFTKHSKVLYVINVQIKDLQVIRKQNF